MEHETIAFIISHQLGHKPLHSADSPFRNSRRDGSARRWVGRRPSGSRRAGTGWIMTPPRQPQRISCSAENARASFLCRLFLRLHFSARLHQLGATSGSRCEFLLRTRPPRSHTPDGSAHY